MFWRVEVKNKPGVFDATGAGVKKSVVELGVRSVEDVRVARVYRLYGDLREEDVRTIARELLTDPLTQTFGLRPGNDESSVSVDRFVAGAGEDADAGRQREIEIVHNPGVMDPVEESTLKGIRDLGFPRIQAVRT